MGVKDLLARLAVGGAHVLLAEMPGAWELRARAESAVQHRGWHLALSPADADILLVCGDPGADLGPVVEELWSGMPGPRARATLLHANDLPAALETLAADLRDPDALRTTERQRQNWQAASMHEDSTPVDGGGSRQEHAGHSDTHHQGMEQQGMGHGGMNHQDMTHQDVDHQDMGHGDMDHGGMDHHDMDHHGMEHGGMDMSPEGIPLAEGDDRDRDGLEMDALKVPLGPVLPHWPGGVVLHAVLHGDLIVSAHLDVLGTGSAEDGGGGNPAVDPRLRFGRRLDHAAAVLSLAGAVRPAAAARRLRNRVLDGETPNDADLDRLERRVSRSPALRWALRGTGSLSDAELARWGLPDGLRGDVFDRLCRLLDGAVTSAEETDSGGALLRALPDLVSGLDVAAARLLVASLGVATAPVRSRAHA